MVSLSTCHVFFVLGDLLKSGVHFKNFSTLKLGNNRHFIHYICNMGSASIYVFLVGGVDGWVKYSRIIGYNYKF